MVSLISVCGCSLRSPSCEVGERLWQAVRQSYAEVGQVAFVLRPLQEREAAWQHYQQVVDAYAEHCCSGQGGQSGMGMQTYG